MANAGEFAAPSPREAPTPSKGRSNADFRKLMATPRRPSSDSGAAPTGAAPTEHGAMQPPKKKQKKWKPSPRKEEVTDSQYRDRAKERREGENPDYTGVQAELTTGFQSVAPPTWARTTGEERQREIEQSKYLGGDMEHTHLVKGLDYALLNRIRSEIDKQKTQEQPAEEEEEKKPDEAEVQSTGPQFRSVLAKNIHGFLFDDIPEEELVKKKLGNSATEVRKKQLSRRDLLKKRVSEAFLKGRTTYVFDVDGKYSQSDIPTIMQRSKRDCPQKRERMVSRMPPEILGKISKLMAYIQPSQQKPRKHKKERQNPIDISEPTVELVNKNNNDKGKEKAAEERTSIVSLGFIKPAPKPKVADKTISSLFDDIMGKAASAKAIDLDDDDIFPDAGSEYVCVPTKRQEEEAKRKQAEAILLEAQQPETELIAEPTKEAIEPRGPTIHDTEMAARAKVMRESSLTQDYFGSGNKKRKRDEVLSHLTQEEKPRKEETDEERIAREREEKRKERLKEIELELHKELSDDVIREPKKPLPKVAESQPSEGEQPMEGVEEGPVQMIEEEGVSIGPQGPPPSYEGGDTPYPMDAYMPYPPPPSMYGDQAYYPDTDAQYGAAPPAFVYHPAPPPTPETPGPDVTLSASSKPLSEQEQRDRGIATVFKRDDGRLFSKERRRDARDKNPTFVPDEYSECYPGAYEGTFQKTVVDDDSDEEDFSKMDMGTKARKKVRPWHFESDEAWNKYNEQMEATPKAAFQFGVKMNDGRRKGNIKKKKKTEDAKINEQLQKINQFSKSKDT